MEIPNILIIAGGVMLAGLVIRLITKSIKAILTIMLVVLGVLSYFFYFAQPDERQQEIRDKVNAKISIVQLKNEACSGKLERKQQIRCDCFVSIIYDDLRHKYSDKEIEALTTQKGKMVLELSRVMTSRSADIKQCLRENDALEMWDELMQDIKSGELFDKMNNKVNDLVEDTEEVNVEN